MWRDRWSTEDGVALVFALLAVIIVGGLASVMLVRASSQIDATRAERAHEQALHVAESSLDEVIEELNRTQFYTTDGPAGAHTYDEALDAAESVQRDWAVEIARTNCTLVPTSTGEACGIRPKLASGELLPWIFGVSFVPDRANPERTRVIKMQFDQGFLTPAKAILTDGDLTLGGSLTIGGENGSVHTNGSLTVNGSAVESTGPVTSRGSFSGSCSGCASGSGSTGEAVDVTPVAAAAVYRREAYAFHSAFQGEVAPRTYEGEWFDLCSDGTVQVPYFDGYEPQPCAANAPSDRILYDATDPSSPARFNGWAYSGGDWSAGGGNNAPSVASPLTDGVYYVHEGNADISGSVATGVAITVIADAEGVNDPAASATDTSCTGGFPGGDSGNISIRGVGGGNFAPYLGDLLFLADRDIRTTGNMSATTLRGFLAAHEQLGIGGTPEIQGAVMAEDACDTTGSPVSQNSVSGNFSLTHDVLDGVPLDSVIRITAWNEYS